MLKIYTPKDSEQKVKDAISKLDVKYVINATVLGVLFSLIMIITAITIKLESSGPVFYRQKGLWFKRQYSQ